MMVSAHRPLPLATTSALTPVAVPPPGLAGAWQRAIASAAGEHAVPNAAPLALSLPAAVNAAPGAARGSAQPPGQTLERGAAQPAPGSINAARSRPTLGMAPAAQPAPESNGARKQATTPLEPQSRATRFSRWADGEQPPVRTHVEHLAGGLAVWLGIDGDAVTVAARAAAVLADLRRQPTGSAPRVARVVCNGTTVYPVPHHAKEAT